jgi:hypothetical protein
MSLFESLGTSQKIRRQLFWIVCIWIRAIVAALAFLVVRSGPEWVAYVVGAVVALLGVRFWTQRVYDESESIWWYRIVHGIVWVSTGAAVIALVAEGHTDAAAIVAVSGLGFDVFFGVLTATEIVKPRHDGPGWIKFGVFPKFFGDGWGYFGTGPTVMAIFTWWTFVHIGFGLLFGFLVSLAGTDTRPIWGLVATAVLFLWEGLENTDPAKVKGASFAIVGKIRDTVCCRKRSAKLNTPLMHRGGVQSEPGPDSPLNSAFDIVFGATALWLGAYLF